MSNETPKTVTVVAPSTLEAGYTFPAQVEGKDFTVTVPEGGVKEGQHFEVPYPTTFDNGSGGAVTPVKPDLGAPKGRWRHDLCDCCQVCCCTGICCNAWCCPGLVVGQIAQRFKLSFCGTPTTDYGSTFNSWAVVWGIYILLMLTGIAESLQLIMGIMLAIVIMNIRYHMRKHYEIQPSCCTCCDGKMDDFCCGCCCTCCVTIQMARHTHDMHQYPYQCCGPTGLPENAPECV